MKFDIPISVAPFICPIFINNNLNYAFTNHMIFNDCCWFLIVKLLTMSFLDCWKTNWNWNQLNEMIENANVSILWTIPFIHLIIRPYLFAYELSNERNIHCTEIIIDQEVGYIHPIIFYGYHYHRKNYSFNIKSSNS